MRRTVRLALLTLASQLTNVRRQLRGVTGRRRCRWLVGANDGAAGAVAVCAATVVERAVEARGVISENIRVNSG